MAMIPCKLIRNLVLMLLCPLASVVSSRCSAEEKVWRFEKLRVEAALCEGDFRKALDLAETLGNELDRAKKSYKAKYRWQLHEWGSVDSDLLVGTVERICGNYVRAKVRFEQALAELKQIKKRNSALFASASATEQRAQHQADVLEAVGKDQDSQMKQLLARLQGRQAQHAGALAGNAIAVVYQAESRMIQLHNAMGSLAVDKAMPLSPSSAKSLKEAETHFRTAQDLIEESRSGAAYGESFHGTHHITFFVNYGNVFLRRAEAGMRFPEVLPEGEAVDRLLERASDYLDEADDTFSPLARELDILRQLAHNGPLGDVKEWLIKTIGEKQVDLSRAEIRRGVDEYFLRLQILSLGEADIKFKKSELAIARLVSDAKANRPKIGGQERLELFEEAEQRLLEAVDNVKLIGSTEDHPFLVLCFSELVILEATRAKLVGRKPDPEYQRFVERADEIMKQKELAQESVQAAYLSTAKELWNAAGG
jgi:hypothetical protein